MYWRTIRDQPEQLPVAAVMARPADVVRQEVMFADDIVICRVELEVAEMMLRFPLGIPRTERRRRRRSRCERRGWRDRGTR